MVSVTESLAASKRSGNDKRRNKVEPTDNPLTAPLINGSRIDEDQQQSEKRLEKMQSAVRALLECVGEDPDLEGLLSTPLRYAKALLFLTKGYQVNMENLVNNALFHEGHNEMVVVKNIEIYSLCEHHLVPFTGKVNIPRSMLPFRSDTN